MTGSGITRARLAAEATGTFALVFAGCAAIVVDRAFGGAIGHVGISLVFGLVVLAMVYSVGNVSGAHINPAVTLGFACARRLPWAAVPGYIAAQLGGALVAGGLLRAMFPAARDLGTTMPAGGLRQAFAMEMVLSFLLMFVILNVSTGHKEKGIMAGVAVGGTVALDALVGGPVSGASMNPARSLGPALWSWQPAAQWLYVAAPCLGAALAYPVARSIQGELSQVAVAE